MNPQISTKKGAFFYEILRSRFQKNIVLYALIPDGVTLPVSRNTHGQSHAQSSAREKLFKRCRRINPHCSRLRTINPQGIRSVDLAKKIKTALETQKK